MMNGLKYLNNQIFYQKKEKKITLYLKIGTIDKDHLTLTARNLEENTAYSFKVHNQASPLSGEDNSIIQQFKFETASG